MQDALDAAEIRIALIEDDAPTREALSQALRDTPKLQLVAVFEALQPALSWLENHQVDVLLTDLGLPDGSGIRAIEACSRRWPACAIMVITMFGDENNVLRSIDAGASGYILKGGDRLDVARAVQDLRDGGSPMSPLIARKVLERARKSSARTGTVNVAADASHALASVADVVLTQRETETLDLIARGYTYEEAGRLLTISISTVRTHIRAIYGKLAVNSRSEAVFEAHKLGLLRKGLLEP